MKTKLMISLLVVCSAIAAVAASDPVLMTINGKEIKLSEFEYLYQKNQQQQVDKETLDQYVDRFVTYKRKVADAEAAGLDTTAAFKKELEGYRNDIVSQYLVDSTAIEPMIQQSYERMKTFVNVDHVMYYLGRDYADQLRNKAHMDSIRGLLVAGEPWDSVALKYSIDPSVTRNNGHYNFIGANMFPIEFEDVVYTTPVGEISQPFKTSYGWHIVRVNDKRPNDGSVHAAHILFMFPRGQEVTAEQKAAILARADSVYDLLAKGGDFAELAKQYTDDKGTAQRGGDLGWFGRNRMVKPFEEVAFNQADGQISKPVETRFGYHIIKTLGHKPIESLDDSRAVIKNAMSHDKRSKAPVQARIDQKKADYGFKANPAADKQLLALLKANGGYDSTFVHEVAAKSNLALYTYDKTQKFTLAQVASKLNDKMKLDAANAVDYIHTVAEPLADDAVHEYYVNNIYRDNKDFRNLLNEYRDGMLLFEVSNRRVWEGAAKDTLGLKNYFETHRDQFAWTAPHFKGIILKADNDSTMQAVKADIAAYRGDSLTTMLHQKYKSKIRMERIPAMAQGENKVVDYLFFGASKKSAADKRYTEFMTLEGGIIDQPQGYEDVKGQVTSQYQDYMEQAWLKELEQKYPVNINRKVLKKMK